MYESRLQSSLNVKISLMRSEQKLQYQSTLKTTTIIPRPGPVSACVIQPDVGKWYTQSFETNSTCSVGKKKLVSTNSRKHRSYCVSSVTQSPHRLKSPLSAKLQRIIYAMPRTRSSDSATNSKQQVCTLSHRLANVFSNVKIKRSKVSTWRFERTVYLSRSKK